MITYLLVFVVGAAAGVAGTLLMKSAKVKALEKEVLATSTDAISAETNAFAGRLKKILGV